MREFVLKLPDIDADVSGKSYEFDVQPTWMARALHESGFRVDPGAGVGLLQVHAQRTGAEILVYGSLRTRFVVDCSRCLGDAPVEVDVRIHTLMAQQPQGPEPHDEELELTPDDLEREYFQGDEIVLDDLVRQHILLECPMQPLCTHDCSGIEVPSHVRPPAEPLTSDGRAVDPRLAPLAELAHKMSNNDGQE